MEWSALKIHFLHITSGLLGITYIIAGSIHNMIAFDIGTYSGKAGSSFCDCAWSRPILIIQITRQVSSMIHSARPIASNEHCFLLFCFSRFEKWGWTDEQHVWKQWSLLAVTLGWPSGSILILLQLTSKNYRIFGFNFQ